MSQFAAHLADLEQLDARGRLRSLRRRAGADFASNDYLALGTAPRLHAAVQEAIARGVPVGSGGSRLLRGNDPEHELLEAEAAASFGADTALFFSSGYAANVAAFATLPQRGDLVVYDALIHASAHDGMRLGRAETAPVPHNDADVFEDAILAWRRRGGTGRPWIAVESVYSMDGDRAPLDDLSAIAARHDGFLLVDEAHATGVFGADGTGLARNLHGAENIITLHTCGKALGCEGALLCLPGVLRDFMVNRARPFIFSTAPSPLMAAAVREALRCLADEPERRGALTALIAHAERVLAPCGVVPTGSQILPLIIGEDEATMALAAALQSAGFDVRGIRPPTVQVGTARLRISLTLHATPSAVEALAAAIVAAQ
ncbi:8-amino-7-oxononanoate synthase [Sphingomonas psychrotolerans]|uniref:8-amino-7-oxononanoate synthase n=1 Tax=Sphingomonas psychrotolerans TaxID=1327635 RepID=A0A2K8MDJ0_9SPHN|nr:8-amino-7-oxononanoate synthase [Sphingomonas psychrotolerans]ATY31962.1 8-amino-7-oxononanoate synthase [Sphingomonas psychrotolerans]